MSKIVFIHTYEGPMKIEFTHNSENLTKIFRLLQVIWMPVFVLKCPRTRKQLTADVAEETADLQLLHDDFDLAFGFNIII